MLHTAPIRGGYTVWTEDHSELLALAEELENIGQELEERNSLLRYVYKQEKKRKEVEEQNRLYDLLQAVTQKQLDKVAVLVNAYQQAGKNAETSRTVLAKIAVLCSFIKRRKHLELLIYRDFEISVSEIQAAFEESLRTLSLLGVNHSLFVDIPALLAGSDAAAIYDFFEDVIEAGLGSLRSINIRAVQLDGRLRIAISLQCDADLSALKVSYPAAEFEKDEDEWTCLLVLGTGGDGR